MEVRTILELLGTTAAVAALGVTLYYYYASPTFKNKVNFVLKRIPLASVFKFLAANTKDTKGVFDKYDTFVVLGRLSDFIKQLLADPKNTKFEDVEDDLFAFIKTELSRYRAAGVKNVPEINDAVLRTNIRVVFDQIKRVLDEK